MDERIELRKDMDEKFRAAMRGDEPSSVALVEAAMAFDLYVRACLRFSGWAHSSATVAKMLGEDPGNYSRTRRGEAISRHRLLVWLGKWSLIASSGAETSIPANMRAPRIAEGDSIFQPPSLLNLEPSLHPHEIPAGRETVSMEVFVRTADGSVYEGLLFKKNFGGE